MENQNLSQSKSQQTIFPQKYESNNSSQDILIYSQNEMKDDFLTLLELDMSDHEQQQLQNQSQQQNVQIDYSNDNDQDQMSYYVLREQDRIEFETITIYNKLKSLNDNTNVERLNSQHINSQNLNELSENNQGFCLEDINMDKSHTKKFVDINMIMEEDSEINLQNYQSQQENESKNKLQNCLYNSFDSNNINYQQYDAIQKLDLVNDRSILQYLFYFPVIIENQISTNLLTQQHYQQKILQNALELQIIGLINRGKYYSSLLVNELQEINGLQIYNFICNCQHLPDSLLKIKYNLSFEQIKYLKNQLNSHTNQDSQLQKVISQKINSFKIYLSQDIDKIKQQVLNYSNLQYQQNERLQTFMEITSSFNQNHDNQQKQTLIDIQDSYLNILCEQLQNYKYKLDERVSPDRSLKSNRISDIVNNTLAQHRQSRYSLMLQEEQEQEIQMRRIMRRVAGEDSQEQNNDQNIRPRRLQKSNIEQNNDQQFNGSDSEMQSQQSCNASQLSFNMSENQHSNNIIQGDDEEIKDRKSNRVQTLKDMFEKEKQMNRNHYGMKGPLNKRKREKTTSTDRLMRDHIPKNFKSKQKTIDKVDYKTIQRNQRKSNWGKIIDYFAESQSQSTAQNTERQQLLRQMGHDQNPNKPQIARLDSLFYKKQNNNSSHQQTLKESQFRRQDQMIKAEDLVKRMQNFDINIMKQKFNEDRSFQSHLNQEMIKIQQQIAKNLIPYNEDDIDDSIYFDEHVFLKRDNPSIILAFKLYKDSLENFNLYASNNKINQICFQFNLFWLLFTHQLQSQTTSQLIKEEILSKIRQEFITMLHSLNIHELMLIKSFEYQTTILMNIIMVIDLMFQEIQKQELLDELKCFVQYLILYTIKVLMTNNLDQARGLLKKEFGDTFIIIRLLNKAFINQIRDMLKQSLTLILENKANDCKTLSFGEFKQSRDINLSIDFNQNNNILQKLDVVLYSYATIVLVIETQQSVENQDYSIFDWQLVGNLLNTNQLQQYSQISMKLLSMFLQAYPKNITQDSFVVIYESYIQKQSQNQQKLTIKQQREQLMLIVEQYIKQQQQNGNIISLPQNGTSIYNSFQQLQTQQNSDILEVYLRQQDQRQIKQLYQKVIQKFQNRQDQQIQVSTLRLFQINMKFVKYIDNENQALIIFKKCMAMAQSETGNDRENNYDSYTIAYMIIELSMTLSKFSNTDKSEYIEQLNQMVLKLIQFYMKTVLKSKQNLSQNEYLIRNESNLNSLFMIFQGLYKIYRNVKQVINTLIFNFRGTWKSNEYLWINGKIQEELFNIYQYLIIKPQEIELIYFYSLKFYNQFLHRRLFESQISQNQQFSNSPLDDDKLLENCDDIIIDCFIYDEQDAKLLLLIKQQNLQALIERLTKNYLISGKDSKVLLKLFQVQGKIDAILLENNEIDSLHILQKLANYQQLQVNDSITNIFKQQQMSQLLSNYLYQIISRVGLNRLCHVDDKHNRNKIQGCHILSETIINNIVLGLLQIFQSELNQKSYAMKLYILVQQIQDIQQSITFKFYLQKFCAQLFFNKLNINQEYKINYKVTTEIFQQFFTNVIKAIQQQNVQLDIIDYVVNYVRAIPQLCYQTQQYLSQNNQYSNKTKELNNYLDFLKSILLQFMVNFQEIGMKNTNVSQLISQIIQIVLPSFFNQQIPNKLNSQKLKTLDNSNNNDAYYFFQYISIQYKINPGSPQTQQNMQQFLELIIVNIEQNLNTLIPNLFLNSNKYEQALSSIVKYVKQDCQIMKQLFDRIVQQEISYLLDNEKSNLISGNLSQSGLCIIMLLDMGLGYLKFQQSIYMNSVQQQQEIVKSQRKTICILILYLMLLLRFDNEIINQKTKQHKTFIISVLDSFTKFISILIQEKQEYSLSQNDIKITVIDNNLNILAFLQSISLILYNCGKILKKHDYSQICQQYVSQLLQDILNLHNIRKFNRRENLQILYYNEHCNKYLQQLLQNQKLQQDTMDRYFINNFYSINTESNNQFLIQSAHQFVLNDASLVSTLILKHAFYCLKHIQLTKETENVINIIRKKVTLQIKQNTQQALNSISMINLRQFTQMKLIHQNFSQLQQEQTQILPQQQQQLAQQKQNNNDQQQQDKYYKQMYHKNLVQVNDLLL